MQKKGKRTKSTLFPLIEFSSSGVRCHAHLAQIYTLLLNSGSLWPRVAGGVLIQFAQGLWDFCSQHNAAKQRQNKCLCLQSRF